MFGRPNRPESGRVIPALLLFLFLICPQFVQAHTVAKYQQNTSWYDNTHGALKGACVAALETLSAGNGYSYVAKTETYSDNADLGTGIRCYYWAMSDSSANSDPDCAAVGHWTHDYGPSGCGDPIHGWLVKATTTSHTGDECAYFDLAGKCTNVDPNAVCVAKQGQSKSYSWTGGFGNKPASFKDSDGCQLVEGGGVAVCTGDGSLCTGTYKQTGSINTGVPTGTESTKTGAGSTTTCSTSSAGNTLCLDELNPNCMTFNGEQVCGTSATGTVKRFPQDNTCNQYDTGSICESGATNKPTDAYGNPVAKNPGNAQTESPSGGFVEYEYYPDGSGDSSTGAGETGMQGTGGTGTSEVTIDGPIEIDESGVGAWSDGGSAAGGNSAQQGIEDGMDSSMGIAGSGIDPTSAMPGYASCDQINASLFGHDFTWPSADGCSKMESVKTLIAWFLYALTALYLFRLATRKPG